MAKRLRVRGLSDEEGQALQRIVRRGEGRTEKSIVKWRRALIVLGSAGGNDVAVLAKLVQTSPDRVREVIHASTSWAWRPWTLGGRVAGPAGSRRLTVS